MEWGPAVEVVDRLLYDDEYMVNYRSPHLEFCVTNTHSMLYKNKGQISDEWKVSSAGNLLSRRSEFKLPSAAINIGSEGISIKDCELKFIAWALSDGNITIKKDRKLVTIYQSEKYMTYLAEIRGILKECGFSYSEYIKNDTTNFGKRNYPLHTFVIGCKQWEHLLPYLDKTISKELKNMSSAQFEIFIDVFNKADGNKQLSDYGFTKRSYTICEGNEALIENLQILAITNGWECNKSVHHYNKNKLFMVHMKPHNNRTVGGQLYTDRPTLTRLDNYKGKVWCVETPNNTLITRFNGKVLIMGNCQIVGRGLRKEPNKKDCILLDCGNVIEELGLPTERREFEFKPKFSKKIDRQLKINTEAEARQELELPPERVAYLKRIGKILDLYEDKVYTKESDLQEDVNKYLSKTKLFWYRQNSGKAFIQNRWVNFASIAGLPDCSVFTQIGSVYIGIELKLPKGYLSEKQKDTLPMMINSGLNIFIAESVAEVHDIVEFVTENVIEIENGFVISNNIYNLPERQLEYRKKFKLPVFNPR